MHQPTGKRLGTLYMIPVTLGDDRLSDVLPHEVMALARKLDHFVVENEKSARRFLSNLKTEKPVREINMQLLNEHTEAKDIPALLSPLLAGHDVGMLSEAGCPGIADPGAALAGSVDGVHADIGADIEDEEIPFGIDDQDLANRLK